MTGLSRWEQYTRRQKGRLPGFGEEKHKNPRKRDKIAFYSAFNDDCGAVLQPTYRFFVPGRLLCYGHRMRPEASEAPQGVTREKTEKLREIPKRFGTQE